jgi:hypothetical protein
MISYIADQKALLQLEMILERSYLILRTVMLLKGGVVWLLDFFTHR